MDAGVIVAICSLIVTMGGLGIPALIRLGAILQKLESLRELFDREALSNQREHVEFRDAIHHQAKRLDRHEERIAQLEQYVTLGSNLDPQS